MVKSEEKRGLYDNPKADHAFRLHQEHEEKNSKKLDNKQDVKDKVETFGGPLDPHERCTLYAYADRLIERKGLSPDEAWEKVNKKIEIMTDKKPE